MGFRPPTGVLGAELAYWREDGDRHSLLTIAGPLSAQAVGAEKLELTLALFDVDGGFVTSWRDEIAAQGTLFVDSREVARTVSGARAFTEGALVAYVHAPSPEARYAKDYARSYAMLDWFSDAGDLVSLHTDQCVVMRSEPLELTEIVFMETPSTRTKLVIVNGPEEQPSSALRLTLRNAHGEERTSSYARAMRPFSVHMIALDTLTPGLVEFCGGREAAINGSFAARGLFTRPYVFTDGRAVSGYHGGNRYPAMGSIPRLFHRTVPYAEARGPVPTELLIVSGRREMNPAYAVHRPGLTTRVHLFQSHGDCEDDFAVDATLYDARGRRAAHRERWLVAPRRGASTGDIAELVPDETFEGHVAFRFSRDDQKSQFPRRLQALVEYRTPVSVARTMLWSDRWNAPDRLRLQTPTRALYRAFMDGRRMTTLAITNPGVGEDYDCEAPYVVRLRGARGEELVYAGTLHPHATKVATIDELFPRRFADPLGTVIVESAFDLASMQLTTDLRSGVVAAEHFMAILDRKDGALVSVCGA